MQMIVDDFHNDGSVMPPCRPVRDPHRVRLHVGDDEDLSGGHGVSFTRQHEMMLLSDI